MIILSSSNSYIFQLKAAVAYGELIDLPDSQFLMASSSGIPLFCLLLITIFSSWRCVLSSSYLIGMGSHDITGPAADVNMMGYANTEQIASGIHFRLKARAFIMAEPDGGNHVAFVNLDACMASQIVTIKVIERLKSRYVFMSP
jgi:neutral ceramidase